MPESMLISSESIEQLKTSFGQELSRATTFEELEQVRVSFLGRNGSLATLTAQLKLLDADQKKIFGPIINSFKQEAHDQFEQQKSEFEARESKKKSDKEKYFDVTAYYPHLKGSLHLYTQVSQEIEDIFMSMGFTVVDGPEVETPFYNFEALNIPENHPARTMHDTFWLKLPGYLMRTHTSNVQIHMLRKQKPPLALCAPGRVYRHEATDATHDFMFRQVEMLFVDKNVSIAHLLGLTKTFLQELFKRPDLNLRVRPSYFPFVEPGLEVDITCPFCTNGCNICKKTTWIEMGGAGLVHPNVFKACNLDPDVWSGCAFGFGLDRLIMLKYKINDIRLLKSLNIDVLKQF